MTTPPQVELARARLRHLLALVALATLPWMIAPGVTQPDTKIDLTLDPWRYLERALSAWSTHSGLGELQNQAYGYLFPMGPVFGVCHSLGVPGWAAQRIWWTILLLLAFEGTRRLTVRLLPQAGSGPALLGAAGYALSPRVLTTLPELSAAVWPMALAPWLVLVADDLRGAGDRRRALRAACATGLLAACLGGVNATTSMFALVPAGLYLLATRWRRLAWWVPAVLLGALWWWAPLVVLGRYAYPFLDYIETASMTTAVTSIPNSLRGASDWIAYILDGARHPTWQAGWVLAQSVTAIVAGCALAGAGAAGLLLRRRDAVTRWALVCVLTGLGVMVLGHAGTVGSPLAGPVRDLLDGPLAALRNVHKAEPLIRLPLVIGMVALLARARRVRPSWPAAAPAALAVLLAVSLVPLWQGREADPHGYRAVPARWTQVAHRIDADAAAAPGGGGATLLLPASRTATYRWGGGTDEPLQALAASPVIVRAAAPLGDPGATRLLDVVDQLASSGRPQPALATLLTRMGIERVVTRRDLAPSVHAQPWQRVAATLAASPGFSRQASWGNGRHRLTLWQLGPTAPATAATSTLTVTGGPDALLPLQQTGLLGPAAVRLTEHQASVVTDTLPWRVYDNGAPNARAYGPTLQRNDPRPRRIGSRPLPPAVPAAARPARVPTGMTGLSVSSSGADPFAAHWSGPGAGPAAAFDGDPDTAWLSGAGERDPWMQFRPAPDGPVRQVRLNLATGPGITLPAAVTVTVHGEPHRVAVRGRSVLRVPIGARRAGTVRITLHAPADATDPILGLRSVGIPGHRLGDWIDIPQRVDPRTQSVLLHRDPRHTGRAGSEDGATLHRRLHLRSPGTYQVEVTARAEPGAALDAVLDAPWKVAASTGAGSDPRHRPGAAVDRDPRSHWQTRGVSDPALTVTLPRTRVIRGITLAGGGAISGVTVTVGGHSYVLGPRGGRIPATRAAGIRLRFRGVDPAPVWTAPRITFDGAPAPSHPRHLTLGCGRAGSVRLGDRRVPLALDASRADLLTGVPLRLRSCGRLPVRAGTAVLAAAPGSGLRAQTVLLRSPATPGPATETRRVTAGPGSASRRVLRVAAGPAATLALDDGADSGWQATTADGRRLAPVTVDGWRQGFRLPAGEAEQVTVTFTPTRWHRAGLAAGALGVMILLLGLLLTGRAGRREAGSVVAGPGSAAGGYPHRRRRLRAGRPAALGVGRWVAPVVAGGLTAGPVGLLVGILVGALPRRLLAPVAGAAMPLAGIALAAFGVVQVTSIGAVAGQLLGAVTLTALARGCADAPTSAPGAPAPRRTPAPASD